MSDKSYLTTNATNRLFDLLFNHDALATKRERGLYIETTNTELLQVTTELVTWLTLYVPLEVLEKATAQHPTHHADEVWQNEAADMRRATGAIEND